MQVYDGSRQIWYIPYSTIRIVTAVRQSPMLMHYVGGESAIYYPIMNVRTIAQRPHDTDG